jgi:hypothetical protein
LQGFIKGEGNKPLFDNEVLWAAVSDPEDWVSVGQNDLGQSFLEKFGKMPYWHEESNEGHPNVTAMCY